MPTVSPEIEGFEDVKITFPDRWLVGHRRLFWENYKYNEDASKVLHLQGLFFGCIAVCEKIEGLPENPDEWPIELFDWIIKTIFTDSFEQARPKLKN